MPVCKTSLVFASRMRAEFRQVSVVLGDVVDWLSDHGFDADLMGSIEIALGEASNNVVEHGGLAKHQSIEILGRVTASSLRVVIIDQGQSFAGGDLPKGHLPDVNTLPEGGFGWLLIHTLTDTLTYHRTETTNILTLKFERQ